MADTVEVPVKRLIELMVNTEILHHLEAGGVDNWEWYSEALKGFDEIECRKFLEEFFKNNSKTP